MRIGMMLPNLPFPPDIRVEKEARVLADAGHEVVLLCRGDGSRPEVEQVGPITVVRHRVHPESTLRRRLDSLAYMITMGSPSWQRGMESLVTEHGAEALHLHDLPYVPSAIRAVRATGVPLVLDLHENYPAAIAQWKRGLLARLTFSPARAARLERSAVRMVDRVVVVVDEAKERVVGLGADPADVVVFGNSEPRSLVPEQPLPLDFEAGVHLVYVGGIARHRGLDTVIAAMPAIRDTDPSATLTIVGDGDALTALKKQAADLGLAEVVFFTGRLPRDEAMEYVAAANIALVPHHRSPHTDSTIPHKLFQYMALGRPVLVSDCAPLVRIVTETHAGIAFAAGDPADLARQVGRLSDPIVAAEMAAAGRRAVLDRWNLEAEAVALATLYGRLGGAR